MIRKYEQRDREAVRWLCCETGYLGKPIDPVFEDRELFADYLTSYYTDAEPESSFVVEQGGEVKGYLLGSRFPEKQRQFDRWLVLRLAIKGIWRYRGYGDATKAYVKWILRDARKEVPVTPKDMPHFHFNLLPEVQSIAGTRALINANFDYLSEAGEDAVFGQVVTFSDRRGAAVFKRYGFEVVERREVTKYRKVHPEPVFLTTIVKQLA
ncbi:MAG: hypothetical protein WA771_01680 [Chthoniobacterales bacterium]